VGEANAGKINFFSLCVLFAQLFVVLNFICKASHFSTMPLVNDVEKPNGLATFGEAMIGLMNHIEICPLLVITALGRPNDL